MKRKVIVECTVDYAVERDAKNDLGGGWFTVYKMVPVTVDLKIKSMKNIGGEIWDWAQSHWDEFLEEDGPEVTVGGITRTSILKWCCVGGILDAKGEDYLNIETKTWASYATPKSKHRPRKSQVKRTNKPKKQARSNTGTNHTPEGCDSSSKGKALPTVEEYMAEKVKKTMLEENDAS